MRSTRPTRLTVSVIVPTYNRAKYVAQAVESLLQQTRVPDEIIVVDDGSTDDTSRVLARFGAPVRVIRQPNRGRSAARNAGLRAASGDAVFFLDSDDMFVPTGIERNVEVLERNPAVGVVYSDAYLCDRNGEPVGIYSEEMPGPRPSGKVLGELMRRNFLTIASMIRRSCLDGITFEEGMEYYEDYDVWRKLAVRCDFQYVDEPLLRYRLHESMTSSTCTSEMFVAQAEVQQRIMAMPEFHELPRRERARAYCFHGIKQAMLGATSVARQYFFRSIRTSPTYAGGYVLGLLSLMGTNVLQFFILKRRQLAGNNMGSNVGLIGVLEKGRRPGRVALATATATTALSSSALCSASMVAEGVLNA